MKTDTLTTLDSAAWLLSGTLMLCSTACGSGGESVDLQGSGGATGGNGVGGSSANGGSGGSAAGGGSAGSGTGATGGSAGSAGAGGNGAAGGTGAVGGTSAGGMAGTGGTGPKPCPDDDKDGVTTCDGDCDDADPITYPGATEQCGDGVDNACGTNPDPSALCNQLGTFVSALTGSDTTGDGTQQNPVQTIQKGIDNAVLIGGSVDVIVAEGDYIETVILKEGISLLGGFQCDGSSCTWAYDPSAHNSRIASGDRRGIDAESGVTRATLVSGLEVAKTPTGSWFGSDLEGATVRNCRFTGDGSGTAFYSRGGLVEDNVVSGGVNLSDGEMYRNSITATDDALSTWGTGVIVRQNTIDSSQGTGALIGGSASSAMIFDRNLVNTDRTLSRMCTSSWTNCAGLVPFGGTVHVTNNVVIADNGPNSVAVLVEDVEVSPDEVRVNGNTLLASRAGVHCVSHRGQLECGYFRNNLMIAQDTGTAPTYGLLEGVVDSGVSVVLNAFENNDIFGFQEVYGQWSGGAGGSVTALNLAATNALGYAQANLSADPLLDGNYHLMSGSPAIDQGTSAGAPANDIDGDSRPAGGAVDIGADERQ